MEIRGKICVVTGGASGIGRALAMEFVRRGAKGVVIADVDAELLAQVAERIGATGVVCDVGDASAIDRLVATTTEQVGPIDIFCSNAGIGDPYTGDISAAFETFEKVTRVNLLAHVAAAKAVVPGMVERGGGYLLQTLSSAALLGGQAPAGYTMTKFGGLGFAEWMSVHYGPLGIRVSCLCPNAVYTGMQGRPKGLDTPSELPAGAVDMLLPEDVAVVTADAMEAEEPFLILPHPKVVETFRRKAADYDGFIAKARAFRARIAAR